MGHSMRWRMDSSWLHPRAAQSLLAHPPFFATQRVRLCTSIITDISRGVAYCAFIFQAFFQFIRPTLSFHVVSHVGGFILRRESFLVMLFMFMSCIFSIPWKFHGTSHTYDAPAEPPGPSSIGLRQSRPQIPSHRGIFPQHPP